MKRSLFSAVLVLGFVLVVADDCASYPWKEAPCVKRRAAVTIDGKLDTNEWGHAVGIIVNDMLQALPNAIAWGDDEWHEKDMSCTCYTMWDEENLYLAFAVFDDFLMIDPDEPWNGNDVEFFISLEKYQGKRVSVPAARMYHIVPGRDNLHTAWWSAKLMRMEVASQLKEDGFVMEAKVPWEDFIPDMKMCEGIKAYFDFNLNDDDWVNPRIRDKHWVKNFPGGEETGRADSLGGNCRDGYLPWVSGACSASTYLELCGKLITVASLDERARVDYLPAMTKILIDEGNKYIDLMTAIFGVSTDILPKRCRVCISKPLAFAEPEIAIIISNMDWKELYKSSGQAKMNTWGMAEGMYAEADFTLAPEQIGRDFKVDVDVKCDGKLLGTVTRVFRSFPIHTGW